MEEECKMGTARISLAHNSRVGGSAAKIPCKCGRAAKAKWWGGVGGRGGCGWWWEAPRELVLSISNGPYTIICRMNY